MRLSYSQILAAHLRNINLVGSADTNILSDFNYNLGQRYQLILSKLQNYRTTMEYSFQVGMSTTLVSSGTSQQIASITSVSTTATVTTSAAHGYSTSNIVTIAGASLPGYNGTYTITVLTTTTFTYTLTAAITTAATTSQYYPFPPGEVVVEGMYVTIGSVNYPLQIINSRYDWEQLNSIQIQASAIPQFYFPRRDDFGIWPTPQALYTGNISYRYRDRNLSVADYATGTVTVTRNSQTLLGVGTTFTAAMVGRWLSITDPTIYGQGYWYRITGFTDTTHMILYEPWTNATATTASTSFIIGETPEIPEELHSLLAWGTAADFYMGMRKDPTNALMYNNLFWTGDPQNSTRNIGDPSIQGGLIGGMNRYSDRDDTHVIKRRPKLNPLQYKVFASKLS